MTEPLPADLMPHYPKKYKSSLWGATYTIILILLLALLRAGAALIRAHMGGYALLVVTIVFIPFLPFVANALFGTVTLFSDRIERKGVFWGKTTIQRKDVLGFKTSRGVSSLVSQKNENILIALPKTPHQDAAWDAWMAGIKNLDGTDVQLIEKLPSTNIKFTKLKAPGYIATCSLMLAVIGFFCTISLPTEFWIVVLIAIPWIILASIRYHYSFFLTFPQKPPRIRNWLSLFISCVGVLLYMHMVVAILPASAFVPIFFDDDLSNLIHIAGPLCGLPLFIATLAVLYASPQNSQTVLGNPHSAAIILAFFLFIDWGYGTGLALYLDTHFSRVGPSLYMAHVTDGPILKGQEAHLKISGWGNNPESTVTLPESSVNIPLSGNRIKITRIDDNMCIWSYPGFIGVPWHRAVLSPVSQEKAKYAGPEILCPADLNQTDLVPEK